MLRIGVALNLMAIACVVTAMLVKERAPVEGAYFNRSVGAPAFAGVYSVEGVATRTP